MALIKCPHCGNDVSDRAAVCPSCGQEVAVPEKEKPEAKPILCEECGSEIPEGAASCPKCGCPVETEQPAEETPEPQKVEISKVALPKMKSRTKTIALALAAIAVIGVVIGLLVSKSNQKKAMENYSDNLSLAVSTMLLGASDAEDAGGLIHDVWYNTIYEKSNTETNQFTKSKYGGYNSDFNTSLANLFADEDFKSKISSIQANQNLTASIMKELTNPPDEFRDAYDAVKKLYDAYLELTNLAVDPTGSLTTFTSNFNDADSATLNAYKAAKLFVD